MGGELLKGGIMKYVVASNIKKMAWAKGKRVGKDFLAALDSFVARKVEAACTVKNGTKITLDNDVAAYVGIR
jgi:hypothetical protein